VKFLFIHQNFPAQFIHLSTDLARDGAHRVVALTMAEHPHPVARGIEVRRYRLLREPAASTHPLLVEQESHVMRAEACAAAAMQLKREGFEPDVIVAHPGWGEALFIKDVFPHAKLVLYCEYYYAAEGQDVGFDPAMPPLTFQQRAKLRLKNTTNLLSMELADAAISPTEWQKSTYPGWAQEKIEVVHDGIDIDRLHFNPNARLTLPVTDSGRPMQFSPGDEVLTYMARNLEPVRGFDIFMRTLPGVLQGRPHAHAIIVGGDNVGYGQRAPDGLSWKEYMLREVQGDLDMSRVHFLNKVPYQTWLDLLSIGRVHAYWTVPFVLSWSFLEAALSGVKVVASTTPPVKEFSGVIPFVGRDYYDIAGFGTALQEALALPERARLPSGPPDLLQRDRCIARARAILAR
jgi:glycosyltransferase involved in cell wall biosynthesis